VPPGRAKSKASYAGFLLARSGAHGLPAGRFAVLATPLMAKAHAPRRALPLRFFLYQSACLSRDSFYNLGPRIGIPDFAFVWLFALNNTYRTGAVPSPRNSGQSNRGTLQENPLSACELTQGF